MGLTGRSFDVVKKRLLQQRAQQAKKWRTMILKETQAMLQQLDGKCFSSAYTGGGGGRGGASRGADGDQSQTSTPAGGTTSIAGGSRVAADGGDIKRQRKQRGSPPSSTPAILAGGGGGSGGISGGEWLAQMNRQAPCDPFVAVVLESRATRATSVSAAATA
jgi:hypothetical protein